MPSQSDVRASRLVLWLVAIGTLLVLGLLSIAVTIGWRVYRWAAFREEVRTVEALVAPWEQQPPPGVDPHVWREVTIVAYNALGNVCYSPDAVSLAEMRRLKADIEAHRAEPVTIDKLDWLWQRLSQTGPHGAEYIHRTQPLWDEAKGWVPPK